MTEHRVHQGTVISVRGDAELEVPPDLAMVFGRVLVIETSKAAALEQAASRLDGVLNALSNLGGVPLTAGDERRPLAWLAHSARTYPRLRWNKERTRQVRTGKIVAEVDLVIKLRDFTLSDSAAAALAGHESYHSGHVAWSVDHDNPGWQRVRSDAIAAAIRKARDYAAALDGELRSLDHLADVGLLGAAHGHFAGEPSAAVALSSRGGDARGAPSLDPAPQVLTAAVEAQFTASVPELSGD